MTSYEMISTAALAARFVDYDGENVVVYMEYSELVTDVIMTRKMITIVTNYGRFEIPSGEKDKKMWKVLY